MIPHDSWPKKSKDKTELICNKFNKYVKNGSQKKKKKNLKKKEEKHKKKHPDALISFLEFSLDHVYNEKEKFEDSANADKGHCERDMKTCVSLKGETNRKKRSRVSKRLPSAFFLFYSEFDPKFKGEHLGLSIGDVAENLGEMRNNTVANDKQAAL